MNIKTVLKEVNFSPTKEDLAELRRNSNAVMEVLREQIKKQKMDADVFLGGSVAKGTAVKKDAYDVDIFVRFDWEIDNISGLLEKVVKVIASKGKFKMEKLHGSRDYFRIWKDKGMIFEIIPVTRIKNPREARNVTDLSYFHVNYVKKKIGKSNLAREIVLAKAFAKAHEVYGAESYISGFSGYALECLIIYYKTLENMLKRLSKAEERIIIDPEKKYNNPKEIVFGLNESKMQGPIVLVDPTWKERNVLAALSLETFDNFKAAAKYFLKNPSKKFFEDVKIDENKIKDEAKRKKADFVHLKIETDRQEGDIAGTKMKKFSNFLAGEMRKYFDIIRGEFVYKDKKEADFYIVAKSRGEIIRIGPPVKLGKAVTAFKKKNKNTFVKNGVVHAKIKANFSAKKFLEDYIKKNKVKIKEMSITDIKAIN